MAKCNLDIYLEKQEEFKSQIKANSLPPDSLIVVQELNYRIDVLETCKALFKAAPVATDLKVLGYHYQLSEVIIRGLLTEHQIGAKVDETGKQKRETAHSALDRVIQDGRKRFNGYRVSTQEQYAKDFGAFINAVLSLWIQYRNTYVKI